MGKKWLRVGRENSVEHETITSSSFVATDFKKKPMPRRSTAYERKIDDLTSQLENKDLTIRGLQHQLAGCQDTIEKLTIEAQELREERLAEEKGRVSELQGELSKIKDTMDQNKLTKEKLLSSEEKLNSVIQEHHHEKKRWEDESERFIHELSEQKEQGKAREELLNRKVRDLEERLQEEQDKSREIYQIAETDNEALIQLGTQYTAMETRVKQVEGEIERKDGELSESQGKTQEMMRENDRLNERISILLVENDSLSKYRQMERTQGERARSVDIVPDKENLPPSFINQQLNQVKPEAKTSYQEKVASIADIKRSILKPSKIQFN